MEQTRAEKSVVNTSYGILMTIVHVLATFLIRTIFIKTLGSEYVGISSLFTNILIILSFAELGIGSAITYSLYKPLAENDFQQISNLLNFFKNTYRVVGTIIFIVGISFVPFLGFIVNDVPNINESINLIYILFVINTSSSYLVIYKSTLLVADQRQHVATKVDILITVLKTIVECFILLLLRNYIVYLVFGIFANIVKNILIANLVNRNYPYLKIQKPEKLKKEEKNILKNSVGALSIYKFSSVILTGFDSIIISILFGTSVVGIYANYILIKNAINTVISQLYNSIVPSIGNYAIKSDSEKQYKLFLELIFIIFWISCFSTTALFILYNPFISLLWGEKQLLSMPIVIAIVLDFYFVKILSIVESFRTANGLFIQGKYRPLAMVIINIFSSVLFAYYWGLIGVILGTIFSRIVTQMWFDPWLIYRNIFFKPVKKFFIQYIKYSFVTLVCCLVTLYFCNLFTVENIYMNFLIKILSCMIIPNSIIYIIYRKSDEFLKLKMLIRRITKMNRVNI